MFLDSAKSVSQNWDALAGYLASQGKTLDRDFEIRQFASGLANLNYLISVDGRPVVFRRPPSNDVPPGAYDFSRQYKILSRLHKAMPVVPEGIAFCNDHSIMGVPFLISEYRKGVAMKRDVPAAFDGIERLGEKFSRLMVETLVQLHRVDPQAVGLDDLGKPEGFMERQVRGWHKRAGRVMTDEQLGKVNAICDWLLGNMPASYPVSIIHLDFKMDNVLIDPETMTVQALIDWELSTLGEGIYDLVMVLLGWGEQGDSDVYGMLSAMPCHTEGWWSRRKVLDEYCRQMNITVSDNDVKFYWILAMMRTFVAMAQLDALYRKEEMPISDVDSYVEDIPGFVNATLQHAQSLLERDLDW